MRCMRYHVRILASLCAHMRYYMSMSELLCALFALLDAQLCLLTRAADLIQVGFISRITHTPVSTDLVITP